MRGCTTLINALRAHLAEFGIVAGVGRNGLEKLLRVIDDGDDGAGDLLSRACIAGCMNHARATLALTRLERTTDE